MNEIPIVLIYHLEHRKKDAQQYFDRIGVKPVFFKGVDARLLFDKWPMPHRIGTIGCYLSFLNAFNFVNSMGYDRVIIGEDDMRFTEGYEKMFQEMLSVLPSDWEAVFLGHYPFGKDMTRINEKLCINPDFHGHHAVMYKKESIEKVLIETETLIDDAFDLKVMKMQHKGLLKIYVADPIICDSLSVTDEENLSTTRFESDADHDLRMEIWHRIGR